ncbi:MAG TPA: PilZ domain-containing protein [Terriglobales bacterium]|nr:PilZ domain-containing protein [Terriglobales bacterium]
MNLEPTTVHPRFLLTTTVMVREAATGAAVLAQLKNISLSGCYLETPRQIAEGARVRVVLQTSNLRADLWGTVRRRDATGVGIQFVNGATVEDWKRLESLITRLQDSVPATASPSNAQ